MGKTLLDIFLFPKEFYERITERKITLYIGIIFIGIGNLGLPIIGQYSQHFINRPQDILRYNVLVSLGFALLLGLMDAIFFAFPLFDFFKVIKKELNLFDKNVQIIRLMKTYISAHLWIVPLNALIIALTATNSEYIKLIPLLGFLITAYLFYIMPVWFSAAITRGVCVILGLGERYRFFVFAIVYLWNFLLGFAFDFVIKNIILFLK